MNITINARTRIKKQSANIANWKENAEKAYSERLLQSNCEKAMINGIETPIVHVTKCAENNKLAGFGGINTTVKNNPICLQRRAAALLNNDLSCICLYCYAESYNNYIPATEKAGLYNQQILTSHLLSEKEIATIKLNRENVRFEMFSDVSNVIQARNYIRIARYFKNRYFAVWSKNHGIWSKAFKLERGKPLNLIYVLSSVHIDRVDKIPQCIEKYVNYVFTVCSTNEIYKRLKAEYKGVKCAGIKCKTCLHCYRKGNAKFVFEMLR